MGLKKTKYGAIVTLNYYIGKKLNKLNITGDHLAFYYLHDILEMLINEKMIVRSFSREVYPVLAERYGVEECTIERNIRNFIKSNWARSIEPMLKEFWYSEKLPTCHQFIYLLKSYILEDIT